MFIASLLYRGKLRDGPACETREAAARALLKAFPTRASCSTARAYEAAPGVWRTIGSDSQSFHRRNLES